MIDDLARPTVVQLAGISRQLVELSRMEMSRFLRPAKRDRQRVARSLLAASIDHASTICFLLESNRPEFTHSALALFRVQAEAFMRGAFFSAESASTDEDVAYFLKHDKLPSVVGEDGKARRLTYNDLKGVMQDHVAPIFSAVGDPGIKRLLDFPSDVLHGPIHGGNGTAYLYRGSGNEYRFSPDTDWLLMVAAQSGVMGLLAFLFDAVYLCGVTDIRTSIEWEQAYERFMTEAKR